MRELPILFSGPMVAALLNTKPNAWPAEPIDESKAFKWMTRRTIKDKDIINGFDIDVDGSVIASGCGMRAKNLVSFIYRYRTRRARDD